MKYKVVKVASFLIDLKIIASRFRWNGGTNTGLVKVLKRINQGIMALETSPKLGPKARDRKLRKEGYRTLIIDKYLIFYFINEEIKRIEVIRIFNCKEDYIKIIK